MRVADFSMLAAVEHVIDGDVVPCGPPPTAAQSSGPHCLMD
jgi:hypothetical protein